MADAAPNPAYRFHVSERPDEVAISISGPIDETSEMKAPDARGRRVVIDAQGVDRINSMGVRGWVELMETLARQSRDIVLVNVPAVLVTQASMISTFFGSALVHSFMTPWVCPSCDNSIEQKHGVADPIPDAIRCPRCGQAMELDWDRDAYLSWRDQGAGGG